MKHLNETTNVRILSQFDMDTGYQAVVQKGNVGSKYVYGLQLRKGATTILRGYRGSKINNPILELSGQAGGHTQTWEFAGDRKDINGEERAGQWFIGVKPSKIEGSKIIWAKQIARVDLRNQMGPHYSNTDFPRLSYLNRAGSNPFAGNKMTHAEAAVSPDYTKFLIATVENNCIGHFTIYNLDTINEKLDEKGNSEDVNLETVKYEDSFIIDNLYDDDNNSIVNSIQGYDLDNDGNIYISSQKAPDFDGSYYAHHKQTVKIPYYARSKESEDQWRAVNLSEFGGLDIPGKHSEVESIQIIGENHCYLTVAYHSKNKAGENKTTLNEIYELSWN